MQARPNGGEPDRDRQPQDPYEEQASVDARERTRTKGRMPGLLRSIRDQGPGSACVRVSDLDAAIREPA